MSISAIKAQDYNPDILNTLANLSSDEVFTPPEVANQVLDMLPQELFRDPGTTFLDPATKSGVFLREIARRLMTGLADAIPDEQERRDHIFHHQLYGIAITQLTSLMSRRSLYCSKFPNGRYSVSRFDAPEGNIRFKRIEHQFINGRCAYCGASESQLGTRNRDEQENYAYEFIHTTRPEEVYDMKFDVIIGNPPYQLDDGGYGTSASPIYNKFVEQALKLSPRYLTMIIPGRWFSSGKGLGDFRNIMLHENKLRKIVDFPDASSIFPGVQIKGGVCYFLWDRDNPGDVEFTSCLNDNFGIPMVRPLLEEGCDTLIRFNDAITILRKVRSSKDFMPFSELVSSYKPFGFRTYFQGNKAKQDNSEIKVYQNGGIGYIKRADILINREIIPKHKVFIPRAGSGSDAFPHSIIGIPFYGEPESICTETYLYIGPFDNKSNAFNTISYIRTKFFRFMVMLKKNAQDAPSRVYTLVPLQDFSKPWTDAELYAKYGLTEEEIAFIESMIRPMGDDGDGDAGQ